MILEYKLDYRSSSMVYEKIFLNQLAESNLNGNISRVSESEASAPNILKLFVEANTTEELEKFATNFSNALPHSIFLYSTEASMVEEMPTEPYIIEDKKIPTAPCPKCLAKIKESYNIFTQCNVCGYMEQPVGASIENTQNRIIESAQKIKEKKIIEINTFYGKYFVGLPSAICNSIEFDILAYDLATVERYANVEEYELNALASFEKPKIKLKKKMKFIMDYEEVEAELIRFRLADDAILYLLMQELHNIGVDVLFISKDRVGLESETSAPNKARLKPSIPNIETLLLTKIENEQEPIEIVASPKHILILKENQPKSQIDDFNAIVKQNNLSQKYKNIAGVNLNREYSNIIIQGERFGLIEYLAFDFSFNSIADIFAQIDSSDEEAQRLLNNYKNKFPELYERVSKIKFANNKFSIYRLWGVIAMILDFADNPQDGAKILEENAMCFLGDRGVRIDYKLISKNGKPHFDPIMTIRTAISFKLAGVDNLGLSYGVIESFLEFITNEIDELQQSMEIEGVVISGSLLSNRRIFSKISQEVSQNHKVYFEI